MFGRLRKLEGRDVTFYALYCKNMQKHRSLQNKRIASLQPVAKAIQYETYRPNAWETELKLR